MGRISNWIRIIGVFSFLFVFTNGVFAESTKALTLEGSIGWHNNFGNYNLGYDFTANEDLMVTHLGVFDYDKNGFSNSSIQVGIFETGGTLLGSTSVVSSDPLDGWFRFKELSTPFALTKDTSYYAIAYFNGGEQVTAQASISTDPNITFGSNVCAWGGPFKLVTTGYGAGWDAGFFGPNFKTSVTPEPVSCFLFLAGGIPFAFRRFKKRGGKSKD